MQDKIILFQNPDIVTRVIDGETILMPIYQNSDEINCIYSLNEAASFAWGLFDGKRTLGAIKKEILAQCDTTPQEVEKQMAILLKDFEEMGALKKKTGKA